MNTPLPARSTRTGFSLIELLAVITIIVILASMSAPVLNSLSNQAGRKGAVNILLNAFEQARIVALSQGVQAYVGFGNATTHPKDPYRSFIIFRDRTDDDPGTGQYVAVTKWTYLPDKISFKSERLSVVGDASLAPFELTVDGSLPRLGNGTKIPALVFSPSGSIQNPIDPDYLKLYIYEGFYAGGKDNFTSPNRTFFERISFRRFTGRAEVDITTAN
ncbi:MAG: prepilin-type N-terminal cleavage/methylation domain-containing protein [Blastochloris sp.]|nr:prepilin-type N-terminal cleavage/methylation domain-containing protein [Blastochloris sp.]